MAPTYSFGWVRQKPDSRDQLFLVPRRITASLPPAFDLSAGMPGQLDQENIGSCGPNTASEHIQYDQKVQSDIVVPPSRLFTYWTTRYLMGTVGEDSGVDNRTLAKALNKYGFCAETEWPYITSKFTLQPPSSCFVNALQNRITSYATVAQVLSQMKGTIVSGFPFVFGFTVFPSMLTDQVAETGIVPMPSPAESAVGGHDVLIYSYSDKRGTFKFRNHWMNAPGEPWGSAGDGEIPYEYCVNPNLAGDFWVYNAVPGVPVPKPTPVPPQPVPVPPTPPVTGQKIILPQSLAAGTYTLSLG